MKYRHYTNDQVIYGITLWKPTRSKKWTIDIFWGKHVFVFLLYKELK